MDKNKKPILERAAARASAVLTRTKKNSNKSAKVAYAVIPEKEEKTLSPKNISQDKIAVRAYFISECRREMGWGGNHESDWIEAENQLRAEALENSAEQK